MGATTSYSYVSIATYIFYVINKALHDTYLCIFLCSCIQWNPSKVDTIGEIKSVLYKEVSFIRGFVNYIF